VIFDSHAPIGTGQGVYISATAEQVSSDNLTRGIEAFSQRGAAVGAPSYADAGGRRACG
jgi:hypothetical protein